MEVQPCADCEKPVSSADIQAGKGGEVGGIYFCADCFAKLQAEEAGDEAPAPAPAPAPKARPRKKAPAQQAPQKAGTGAQRRVRKVRKDASEGVKPVTARTARVQKQKKAKKKKPASEKAPVAAEELPAPPEIDDETEESGKKGSPLVLIMIIVVALLTAVLVILLVTGPSSAEETQVADPTPTGGTENPTPEPEPEPEPEPKPEPEPEPAPAPPAESAEAKALGEIQDALKFRDLKTAFRLAKEAKNEYPDDQAIAQTYKKVEEGMSSYCSSLFEKAQQIETTDEKKAKELYSEISSLNVPGFSDEAENAYTQIDAKKNAAKMKIETEARSIYLNASVYFNDFMEETNRSADTAPPEALEFLNTLLKDYPNTDFVKAKKDIIEMQIRLLKGGKLPD